MGGAVSSGQDNDDLINNLKSAGYIKTPEVERVFRIVDRAHYYLVECRDSAYKDLAWKSGTLHLSAPCIYSEVMEALELKTGLSFLNLGSGTGYLNTMVGFMIGPYGINHGIELHADNVVYANKKLESFIQTSRKFDDLELCEPQFVVGNCLNLAPENQLYDRVYCGASCPPEQKDTIQNMIKVNGILVIPVGDQLLKIKRISKTEFTTENVLPVSFASLILPVPADNNSSPILLPDVTSMSLQCLCRLTIRNVFRANFDFSLPPVHETSSISKIKHIKATKFFRSEVSRHPLNILPTAQGLMLLAAFDSSDDDDDEDEGSDDTREHSANSIRDLNMQIRRHASSLRASSLHASSLHARDRSSNNGTNDVDSDLSDMEDEGIQIPHLNDVNGNRNSSFCSNSDSPIGSHDSNKEDIEEKFVGHQGFKAAPRPSSESLERNGKLPKSSLRKSSEVEGNIDESASSLAVRNSYEKSTDRILTNMSPRERSMSRFQPDKDIISSSHDTTGYQPIIDELQSSEFNIRSSAIQVTPSSMPVPRAIKESYSTSADTSETSGFGSLCDDNINMSSQQSGLGSLKDDLELMPGDDFVPVSSSPARNYKRSPQSKSSIGESSMDYDSLMADSADTAWVDTEDEDDDTHIGACKLKKIKSDLEHTLPDKKGGNSDTEAGDDMKNTAKGPDFSAFLKSKVDTLPLPSSLKAFILYYRQAGQTDGYQC